MMNNDGKTSAVEIFTATLFATVAFIGGAVQVKKLYENNRFKGFIVDTFKESDQMYYKLFDILEYVASPDTSYNESIQQRKYTTDINNQKKQIARDLVCVKPKDEWFYSFKRFRLYYYRKASKHTSSNGKTIMKKKIMMMSRNREHSDYFKELILSKDFKPELLYLISSEAINKDIDI